VYADIFDTSARRVSAGSPDVLSYRDFFRRAKDAVVTVDLEFNRIWWRSESLRDIGSAAGQPHFGVEEVGGRLRIGCFDGGCD
jgi:hypothetical protein